MHMILIIIHVNLYKSIKKREITYLSKIVQFKKYVQNIEEAISDKILEEYDIYMVYLTEGKVGMNQLWAPQGTTFQSKKLYSLDVVYKKNNVIAKMVRKTNKYKLAQSRLTLQF